MRSSPGRVRVWSSVPGAATAISPLTSPSRSPAAATTPPKPPRRSVPLQWYSSLPLADDGIGASVPVEIVEPGDVPSEGPRPFPRRVGAQHRAVLAAQEVDPTAVP